MVCGLPCQLHGTRNCEHRDLTLARNCDAVHNITVIRSNVIPNVRRPTPSKYGLAGLPDPETMCSDLGEEVNVILFSSLTWSLSETGTAVPSAAAGGTGATATLMATRYLKGSFTEYAREGQAIKGSASECTL